MDMGVAGSVYSTGLGAAVMILISLTHFIRKKGCLRFSWPRYRFDQVVQSFRTGFATSVQYVYQFITILVCNRLLMSISGELGVAVFGIVFNVALLAASVYDAISMALQPMVSTFHGERNKSNIRCTLRQAFKVSLVVSVLLAAVLLRDPPVRVLRLRPAHGGGDVHGRGGHPGLRPVRAPLRRQHGADLLLPGPGARSLPATCIFTLRSFVLFLFFGILFSRGGVELFWWTYPAMELATLAVLCLYNQRKGSWTYLDEDDSQIFSAFLDSRSADLGAVEQEVSAYLEGIDASPTQSYFAAIAVEEVCGVILNRAFSVNEGYIQFTIVPHEDGTVTIHLRDNAREFNPFELNTDEISLEEGTGLDAIGVKMIKSKAKEFFYRRYAGFNTLVVRV